MMSSITEGGETPVTLALSAGGRSTKVARAKGRMRRGSRGRVPVLVAESTGRPNRHLVLIPSQHERLQAARDVKQSKPENIQSLAKYRPGSKNYQVSLTFSDKAGTAISELMTKLEIDNPNEVAKLGIALLLSAQGQEILLRDRETGIVEVVEI